MNKNLTTTVTRFRLGVITMLLVMLSVAFVAQFFDSVSYFDDAAPVRFVKVSESSPEDGESPSSHSPSPVALPASYTIVCTIVFALVMLPRRRLTLRPAPLYRLPPRAPPASH